MTNSHSVNREKERTKMASGVLVMLTISSILIAPIIVTGPAATASFVTPAASNSNTTSPQNDETGYTPGVQPLTTADLATPGNLTAASSCQGTGSANIAVSLSWSDSQSSSLDADQNPLLSGYTVWRSASPSGPFTQVGSVASSGSTQAATSYTDVNPSGAPTPYAYVANANASTVSVIDTSTNAVTTTIALPAPDSRFTYAPDAVAITPNGSYAYVAVYVYKTANSATENGVVDVIDTSTNTVTTTISLTKPPAGLAPIPTAVAITPNGCSVYVTDFDNDIEDVIDTSSNTVTTTITLTDAPDLGPYGVAITPNDSTAYVATYYNYNTSTYTTIVDPLDLSNNTLGSTITVGSGPYAVAVQPSTYYYEVQAYATNWTSAYSAVIPITLGFVY